MTEPVHTFAADPRNEFDRPDIFDRLDVLYDLIVEQYDPESEDYNPHAAAVNQARHFALLQEAIDTGLIEPGEWITGWDNARTNTLGKEEPNG